MDRLAPKTKTNSFKILGHRPPGKASYEAILVHPFKRSSPYGSILEYWVQESVAASTPGMISRVFTFDLVDAFGDGGLVKVSKRLLERIKKLRDDTSSPLYQATIPTNDSEGAITITNAREAPQKPQSIVFIAHSIGAWVVKNALAYWNSGNIAFDPSGIVFVDLPEKVLETVEYPRYLEALSHAFEIKLPRAQFFTSQEGAAFCKLLGIVDGNFEKFKQSSYIQQETGVRSYYLNIWVSQMPLLVPNKKPKRIRRLVSILRTGKHDHNASRDKLKSLGLDDILRVLTSNPGPSSSIEKHGQTRQLENQSTAASLELQLGATATPLSHLDSGDNQEISPVDQDIFTSTDAERWSSNVSRPSSMKTALLYAGEGEKMSLLSTPHFPLFESPDHELNRTTKLARSFFQRGELMNAEILFNRSRSLMEGMTPQPDVYEYIKIHTQIAVIALYRGRYQYAKTELDLIKKHFDPSNKSEEEMDIQHDVERWFATALLLQGKYEKAAKEFENLLAHKASKKTVSKASQPHYIQVRRDLALTYGYLGRHKAAQQNIEEAEACLKISISSKGLRSVATSEQQRIRHPEREPSDVKDDTTIAAVRAKGFSIILTGAVIDMLWGEYDSALHKSTNAYQGITTELGRKHIKALHAASLKAMILAYSSRYLEAEKMCKETLQIMSQELGREHPLLLETMGCLVYILRAQSRLAEARDTAISLCKLTKNALTPNHPQTLRASSLLTAVLFSIGEYRSAELEIQETLKISEENYGILSPDGLRYNAELARVILFCGKVDEAGSLALDVIQKQRELYSPSCGRFAQKQISDSATATNKRGEIIRGILEDIYEDKRTFKFHPSMVFALQVVAMAEMQMPEPDVELAKHSLEAVVKRREKKLGKQHAMTLASKYELATVLRENDQDLQVAKELLLEVWRGRVQLFGKAHVETLSAKRELIITQCVCGDWQSESPEQRHADSESVFTSEPQLEKLSIQQTLEMSPPRELNFTQWADVADVSQSIVQGQEPQLGPYHPETLKSLMWLFTVLLLLSNKRKGEADATCSRILARLRQECVRKERIIESLKMEEKIALLYSEQGHYNKAIEIMNDIVSEIEKQEDGDGADPALQNSLRMMKMDVQLEIAHCRPGMKDDHFRLSELRDQADAEDAAAELSLAEKTRSRIWAMSKSLFGDHDPQTLDSRIDLAQIHWEIGSQMMRQEALATLKDMRSLGREVVEPEILTRLTTLEKAWTEEAPEIKKLASREEVQADDSRI